MAPVTRLTPSELTAALPRLLSPDDRTPADRISVDNFLRYLEVTGLPWEGWRGGSAAAPRALALVLLIPGRTGMLLGAPPGALGIDAEDQEALLRTALEDLRPRGLHYLQALLPPEAQGQQALLGRVGFRPLAPLLYLQRGATYPWVDPPAPEEGDWLAFREDRRRFFQDVLVQTYLESLDCPELNGLRPPEDILAAHQASGEFRPELWEILMRDGAPAGCLLLSRLPNAAAVEVVYMGVPSAARRQGAGRLLLRRALQQVRAQHVQTLTLVVDGRNKPARALYESFNFTQRAWREGLLFCWSSRAGR